MNFSRHYFREDYTNFNLMVAAGFVFVHALLQSHNIH